MSLDISKLSEDEKNDLFLEIQKYKKGKITEIPQGMRLRAEIVQCIIQSNIPNTRVTALSHSEKVKHPLYRVVDSFFDEQGDVRADLLEPMREEHTSISHTSSGVYEFEREEDWNVKVSSKADALRTIQSCLLGTVYRNRIEESFGCTEGIEGQQHGDEIQQLFAYLEKVFLPRGATTELTGEEQQGILENLPNYAWEAMRDWKHNTA